MPMYRFVCKECGTQFERFASFRENLDIRVCPHGHANVRRVYSAAPVVFKGSGWYSTDNRPKEKHKEA